VSTAEQTRVAYEAFAGFYDDFTAHHDVEAWIDTLEGLALEAGLTGRRALDLGCGTGRVAEELSERGYEVCGCDISPAMLACAGSRLGGRARLVLADLRALPRLGRFDVAFSTGDVLNYLEDRAELEAAFSGVCENLAAGGVLVFDVNTLATFRRVYSSVMVLPADDRVLMLEGSGSPELEAGGTSRCRIARYERGADGWWSRTATHHVHHHHPEHVLRHALVRAGFEVVAVVGTGLEGTVAGCLDELRHNKAVYVARRSAP
jgi:predicted TPR repeat methyltransferase